jgi:hypothetical protein
LKPLEISFHGRDKNEASAAANANSYFHAAFGHWFNQNEFNRFRLSPYAAGKARPVAAMVS